MFKVFIERPVLSTVISILFIILGLLGLSYLPLSQYPDIAPPTVVVSATYTGANADVVLKSVVAPLEEQINGVENMTYMSSTATNEGVATVTVYFKVGTDPDLAAVNVQNRASRANSLLPAEVSRSGVTVAKSQSSNVLIFSLSSTNKSYDLTYLQNYAKINLIPKLQRVSGVGTVSVFGVRDYAMRIWLKPDVMASYALVPSDVTTILAEQNLEAAPGKFGENSRQAFQYVIKYKGRLVEPQAFGDIIIKSVGKGQVLRLKDIARIELGAQTYSGVSATNGNPAAGIAVTQTAGSNASEIIKSSLALLDEAAKLYPKGIVNTVLINQNEFLDASIDKVVETLLIAFGLVILVVLLFLQDWRSTLIPAVSVPVAIVGTFFFLNLFGFTLNLLTLFALVLAIGIVVDDPIVVVEAVHAKLDAGYTSARQAAIDTMGELSGVIIAITLVMAAVFVPVTFITGSSGVFYQQFGITLAVAIIISAINALTLSPALCALLLKPKPEAAAKSGEEAKAGTEAKSGTDGTPVPAAKPPGLVARFITAFNAGFEALKRKYTAVVTFLIARVWLTLGIALLFGGGLVWLIKTTPASFVPNEDQGIIFAVISLPPASSMERTDVVAQQIDSIAHTIPAIENTLRVSGQNILAGTGSAYGMVIIKTKLWDERKGVKVDDIIGQLMAKTRGIRGAQIFCISPPTVPGFGQNGGFELQLLDKAGGSSEALYKASQKFLAALAKRPEIMFANTPFNPDFPQFQLDVNVAKCEEAGVTVSAVLATMQGYYGGLYASDFNQFGKPYRVMVQADYRYRASEDGLSKVYVRTTSGTMAPISEFVSLTRVYGAESLSRFNLFSSATVTGSPKPGYSSGDAIKAIEEVAKQTLPAAAYGYEFSGLTREEISGGSQIVFILALCVVFVYFLLSAQYESYIVPFAVLFSLPIGLTGTFVFDKIFGIDNNIYTQICMIMLIGLLSKNAILIVEYALDRRRQQKSILDAAVEGAGARLRPILMTSFAFICGLFPLMIASGAGAVGNRAIGTGAVGGMLFGTLLGVFVIPALFTIFQGLQERISGPPPAPAEGAAAPADAAPAPAPAAPNGNGVAQPASLPARS